MDDLSFLNDDMESAYAEGALDDSAPSDSGGGSLINPNRIASMVLSRLTAALKRELAPSRSTGHATRANPGKAPNLAIKRLGLSPAQAGAELLRSLQKAQRNL